MQETLLQLYKSTLSVSNLASHQMHTNVSPELLWVQVFADFLTGISFFIIPLVISYFFYKRKELRFSGIRMLIAGIFFISGISHFLDIYFLLDPNYWLVVSMKVSTTVISIFTAIALVRLMPEALKIQSPEHFQKNALVQSNLYEELKVSQESLVETNLTLEGRINRRNIELKRNEESLRIAAIVFESQEGMFVTDAKKCIIRVNHAFTIITGYSEKEVIGKNPKLLNSGKHDSQFFTDMWLEINNNGVWKGEIWNRRKSGEVYNEKLTITGVNNAAGILTNYVATLTDITISNAAAEKIKQFAFYDQLTQLPNRRLLLDKVKHALSASARSGQRGALMFLDLDHFKNLNDTLGHSFGDLLLQQVALRLTASVRQNDTVTRIGGDEFVILLENLSGNLVKAAAQAKLVAEKIISTLNEPYTLNTHIYNSTPSIGIALFNSREQVPEDLMRQADIAMYESKAQGRNTFSFFDPLMQEIINNRVKMESELRTSIKEHQFKLYYQVQVDSDNRPVGAEVLIRWMHPKLGMVYPAAFIPFAEETGLIVPIGNWVINEACSQLKAWQRIPLARELVLAVNVSAKQFHQKDFVTQVKAAIKHHNVNPALLKLELTESMLLNDIDDIIVKMDELRKVGVQFSLDDFGTGYSSLQYLKKLPLTQLKIDQSFVRDITVDASDRAIVRTIIVMAESLGINVIAEGVETIEQRQYLFDNGCSHYQGYLFSKPLPINLFEARLKQKDTPLFVL